MTKVKRIPRFRSIAEEARFWDTHDVTDYLSEMKEVKVTFDPSAPKEEILTIRIQSGLKRRLEKMAKSYGINLSTLARILFIDKVRETKDSRFSSA